MVALRALPPILSLPPAYRLVAFREAGDAFAHACRIAPQDGAGAFVWVRRFDVLEFAVVLEPEEPLVTARRALFAGMAAMAEALASYSPPEKPIGFDFPLTLLYDGARMGGGRLGWPKGCAEEAVPDWLVFSGLILAARVGSGAPGACPGTTWLEEEGFASGEHLLIVESFARHLMMFFDAWGEEGFKAVADAYLARLPREGGRRGIDGNGDLLLHRNGPVERVPLGDPRQPAWLDPETGLPRLA